MEQTTVSFLHPIFPPVPIIFYASPVQLIQIPQQTQTLVNYQAQTVPLTAAVNYYPQVSHRPIKIRTV